MDKCSPSLPSPLSADDCWSLFEWFSGTTPQCDSSQTYTRAVRPEPSPADLLPDWAPGISEVSRFSCMKFLGVLWGLRLRQTERELALSLPLLLPAAITRASASGLHLFGAQYPPHLFPCLRFVVHLAMPNAKLGAEWIASPFS